MSTPALPPPPKYTHWLKGTPDAGGLHGWLSKIPPVIEDVVSRSGTYATRTDLAAVNARLDEGVSVSDGETAAMIEQSTSATHQAVAQIAAEANAGIVQHPQHPGLYMIVSE